MPPTHVNGFKYTGEVYPEWNDEYVELQVHGLRMICGAVVVSACGLMAVAQYGLTSTTMAAIAFWAVLFGLRINYYFGRRRWLRYASYVASNAEPVQTEIKFASDASTVTIKDVAETKVKLDEPPKRREKIKNRDNYVKAIALRSPQTREWLALETDSGLWRLHADQALRQCVMQGGFGIATTGANATLPLDERRRLSPRILAE